MCSLRKDLINRSINKGVKLNKDLSHRVVAIGFNSKNDMIGIKTNGFGLSNSKGSGKHAERELIKRYGFLIDQFFLLFGGVHVIIIENYGLFLMPKLLKIFLILVCESLSMHLYARAKKNLQDMCLIRLAVPIL